MGSRRATAKQAKRMATTPVYEVHPTNFHAHSDTQTSASPYGASEEIISRHHTREAAERAAKRYASDSCSCGCAVVLERRPGES